MKFTTKSKTSPKLKIEILKEKQKFTSKYAIKVKEIESFLIDEFSNKYQIVKFLYMFPHVGIKKTWTIGVIVMVDEKRKTIKVGNRMPSLWAQILFGGLLYYLLKMDDYTSMEVEVYNKLFLKYGQ